MTKAGKQTTTTWKPWPDVLAQLEMVRSNAKQRLARAVAFGKVDWCGFVNGQWVEPGNPALWEVFKDERCFTVLDMTDGTVCKISPQGEVWPHYDGPNDEPPISGVRLAFEHVLKEFPELQSLPVETSALPASAWVTWVKDEIARMRLAGKLHAGIKITDFAKGLETSMQLAVRRGSLKKAVSWKHIKNSLPALGLWPIK